MPSHAMINDYLQTSQEMGPIIGGGRLVVVMGGMQMEASHTQPGVTIPNGLTIEKMYVRCAI